MTENTNEADMEVTIIGVTDFGRRLSKELSLDETVVFADNDSKKWGTTIEGCPVKKVEAIKNEICILTVNSNELRDQLQKLKIEYADPFTDDFDDDSVFGHALIKLLRNSGVQLAKDRDSLIEFYLVDAFEIYHYLPFYKAFLEKGIRARIIAEPCEINTSGKWFDFESAVSVLKSLNIDYCTRCNPDAKIVFTTQEISSLRKYKKAVKVNLHYGLSFQIVNYGNSRKVVDGFDYSLVHSEYLVQLLEKFHTRSKLRIIGYPKYHEFLSHAHSKDNIRKSLHIETDKPVLLYLPTWDEDCGLVKFGEQINALRQKYFVVIKPHHCLDRLEECREKKKIALKISDLYLKGNDPFEEVVYAADCIIADSKSGACMEAALLNPEAPMLLLNARNDLDNYYNVMPRIFTVVGDTASFKKMSGVLKYDPKLKARNESMESYYSIKSNGFDDVIKEFVDLTEQ